MDDVMNYQFPKYVDNRYGAIYDDGSMCTVKGELIPRDEMKELINAYKSVNRIHKPMALLWYTDAMNGKICNWQKDSLRK